MCGQIGGMARNSRAIIDDGNRNAINIEFFEEFSVTLLVLQTRFQGRALLPVIANKPPFGLTGQVEAPAEK